MDTLKQLKVAVVVEGTEATPEIMRLAEISERANLNRLWGMEPRNKYPAFRDDLDIESVREATFLLLQAERTKDAAAKRNYRYQASRVIYPHQGKEAVRGGFNMILKAHLENE